MSLSAFWARVNAALFGMGKPAALYGEIMSVIDTGDTPEEAAAEIVQDRAAADMFYETEE
jgi:hypothetical protein